MIKESCAAEGFDGQPVNNLKGFQLWYQQASTRLVGKLQFGRAPLLGASISMSKTSSVQPNLALSDDLVISRSLMLLLAQLSLLIFQLSPAIA